jgi:hypothetical protein
MIYVSYAKAETNGLIFPKAVNQLFTGLYFLELCLVGLFFLQEDERGNQSCFPHAIVMVIMLIFTVLFQIVLNRAFGPLFTYLPITFEDEAVKRDEEWQRAQASRWKQTDEHTSLIAQEDARSNFEETKQTPLAERKHRKSSHGPESYELDNLDGDMSAEIGQSPKPTAGGRDVSRTDRSRHGSNSRSHSRHARSSHKKKEKHNDPFDMITNTLKKGLDDVAKPIRDAEAQVLPAGNLFDEVDDELADMDPEARQKLIKRSFQHPATRAIQPAVWIPHDELGVAKDEIERTSAFTKRVWITSVNARLDASGNVIYKGLPPDRDPFENIEV